MADEGALLGACAGLQAACTVALKRHRTAGPTAMDAAAAAATAAAVAACRLPPAACRLPPLLVFASSCPKAAEQAVSEFPSNRP